MFCETSFSLFLSAANLICTPKSLKLMSWYSGRRYKICCCYFRRDELEVARYMYALYHSKFRNIVNSLLSKKNLLWGFLSASYKNRELNSCFHEASFWKRIYNCVSQTFSCILPSTQFFPSFRAYGSVSLSILPEPAFTFS